MVAIIRNFGTGFVDWRSYCILLIGLFLARGIFLLSVYPPFEGWDEYQHVGYLEYLIENGRAPVLHKDSLIPESLHKELVRWPHSKDGVDQLQFIGGVDYKTFWKLNVQPVVRPDAPRIHLYQAQHSSFYYRCVLPIYKFAKSHWGLVGAITTLRIINVLCGAAAVALILGSVGRLVRPGTMRHLLGLLIALQPLFLLNCARVANDGPAILFGAMATVVLIELRKETWLRSAILGGIALGLAILCKTIHLGLMPLLLFVFVMHAVRVSAKQAAIGFFVSVAIIAVITGPYFAFNLQEFGMLTPMQEAVKNRADGKTLGDFARAATELNWWHELSRRYFRHSLWRGGWSMIMPEWQILGINRLFVKAHAFLIYGSMIGALLLISKKRREERRLFDRGEIGWRIVALWAGVTASLAYHMLHTFVALPNVATNIWYAALTFPWLLVLFAQGVAALPGRATGIVCALLMTSVFFATEVYGTLVAMVSTYTSVPWGPLARARLDWLHPFGPNAEWTIPALISMSVFSCVAILAAFRAKEAASQEAE